MKHVIAVTKEEFTKQEGTLVDLAEALCNAFECPIYIALENQSEEELECFLKCEFDNKVKTYINSKVCKKYGLLKFYTKAIDTELEKKIAEAFENAGLAGFAREHSDLVKPLQEAILNIVKAL